MDQLIKKTLSLHQEQMKFDIIIFDLGLSSNQIQDPERGFSFEKDGPLDMRMGKSKLLVSDIVNNYSENELSDIIFNLGEERYAKKIAKKITEQRRIKIIKTTTQLAKIIKESIPFNRLKKIKIKSLDEVTHARVRGLLKKLKLL